MPTNTPGNRPDPPWRWMGITRGLLAANMLLWLGVGIWILAGGEIGLNRDSALWWILLLGLLIDGFLYGWIAFSLPRHPVAFGLAGVGLAGVNLLLTLSDQMGAFDWAILALVAAPAGLSIAFLWRNRSEIKPPRAG